MKIVNLNSTGDEWVRRAIGDYGPPSTATPAQKKLLGIEVCGCCYDGLSWEVLARSDGTCGWCDQLCEPRERAA